MGEGFGNWRSDAWGGGGWGRLRLAEQGSLQGCQAEVKPCPRSETLRRPVAVGPLP